MSVAVEDGTAAGRAPSRAPSFPSPLVLALIAILLVLIVPPVVYLINVSLHETEANGAMGAFTTRFYREIFAERHFGESLRNTLIYATGSSAVGLVIGTLQALIVERTNAPGRGLVFYGAIMSLGVPHVLYVVAWLLLLGRSGPINDLIATLPFGQGVDVYSMWGMVLIEGVGFAPLTFLMMSAALRATDPSFEESALMSGAGPVRVFSRVTLRMGLPAFAALLLLTLIKAFESFEVPALVGLAGNVDVLTTTIWQSAHGAGTPNYGEAGAYSVCLILIVGGLLAPQSRLARNAHRYQSVTGKGFRPRVIDLTGLRWPAAGLLLTLFLFVTVVPVAMLLFTSLQPFYEGVTWDSFTRLSL
jgi:iron(III) transport system permease protein